MVAPVAVRTMSSVTVICGGKLQLKFIVNSHQKTNNVNRYMVQAKNSSCITKVLLTAAKRDAYEFYCLSVRSSEAHYQQLITDDAQALHQR